MIWWIIVFNFNEIDSSHNQKFLKMFAFWLAEGWSLILADPDQTRPNLAEDVIFSEQNWADIWAET